MRSAEEVLGDRSDLSTVADCDGAVVAVSIVVDWLLVVLETLHKRYEVVRSPPFGLEVVCEWMLVTGHGHNKGAQRLPQSDAEARVYIWKLMLLPPPRMFAHGTMERRPRRCDDFMVSV